VKPIANTATADYTYIGAVLYYCTILGTSFRLDNSVSTGTRLQAWRAKYQGSIPGSNEDVSLRRSVL